jgi:hypothetical protein
MRHKEKERKRVRHMQGMGSPTCFRIIVLAMSLSDLRNPNKEESHRKF